MRYDPKPVPACLTLDEARRFWSHVDRRGDDDCWPWVSPQGGRPRGYPNFYYRGRSIQARRVAYESFNGPLGRRRLYNSCHNNICVNPGHLTVVPVANPGVCGERHWGVILTEADVLEVMERHIIGGETQVSLAREKGVDFRTINNIFRGTSWKHLPRPRRAA